MTDKPVIELDAGELLATAEIEVHIRRYRQYYVRYWLAGWPLRIAARLGGFDFTVTSNDCFAQNIQEETHGRVSGSRVSGSHG